MTQRRGRLTGAAAALTVTLAAGALAAPASAATPRSGHGDHRHAATQRAFDGAVKEGVPGVTGEARDKYGTWKGTSGLGDLERGIPRGKDDRFRVGSITKTFVATVLLQFQAEGRIDLDDAVGTWLPGVVEGNGHDGDRITVRQLLNHTSGIFDATRDEEFQRKVFTKEFLKHRYDTWTPEQLVKIAMGHAPAFEPGEGWQYNNTNYLLAGMIIKKVTGRTFDKEIKRRIIEPLGLEATSVPVTDPRVPGPHSKAYSKLHGEAQDPTYDLTELNPSVAGSAGAVISDAADLNTFYAALLGGELLPKKQLAEMKHTTPVDKDDPLGPGYGLGLERRELSCGQVIWGHDGDIHGSSNFAVTTPDARHSLAYNFNGDWAGEHDPVLEAEFCDK
ncbi:serine hydrolase domain-containing protein [Streptomyces sp. NPDC087300]|uniref:serine hydrolase domain-containing protein n=1 Tax=Streptomyces sp. NPDC087300 TaxID=3365780 RepID=UPI0037FD3C7F